MMVNWTLLGKRLMAQAVDLEEEQEFARNEAAKQKASHLPEVGNVQGRPVKQVGLVMAEIRVRHHHGI